MPLETRARAPTPELTLPPPFTLVRLRELGDAFAHAASIAPAQGAGTLVYVGKGKHPPAWVKEVLLSRDRSQAAPTFGPEGLYLEKIQYDARWRLPQ
jgi:hypothetical protein